MIKQTICLVFSFAESGPSMTQQPHFHHFYSLILSDGLVGHMRKDGQELSPYPLCTGQDRRGAPGGRGRTGYHRPSPPSELCESPRREDKGGWWGDRHTLQPG